ncbi:MAG TPA: hypothetical protein PLK99_05425 [Burkholderiales bacterium]|nr:hypothetical protein [Burkholderiales bacterium]
MGPLLLSMAGETVLWPSAATLSVLAAGYLLKLPMHLASALAIASGFFTAYSLIYGVFAFPPAEAQGWIPFLITLNLIVFSIDDRIGFSSKTRLAIQATLAASGAAVIYLPVFRTGFSIASFLSGIALWLALWIAIDRQYSPALFLVAAGNAIVSATTGSTMLGQFGGALAAVMGIHLAFNIPKIRFSLGHAGSAVSASILGSLMLTGHVYAQTALTPTLLLFLAFFGPAAAKRLIPGKQTLQFLAGTLLSLVPVAIASAMAIRSYFSREY